MKWKIGDVVVVRCERAGSYLLHAEVEDASKGDVIQAKVTSICNAAGNAIEAPEAFPYSVGKVDEFDRKDILGDDH